MATYQRLYYLRHETQLRKKQADRKHDWRERNGRSLTIFRAAGCLLCGEAEPVCLCSHHVIPQNKKGEIARMLSTQHPARFTEELAKCVCLCANCHAKVHAGLVKLP